MPYLTKERREILKERKDKLSTGDLNYLITMEIINYIDQKKLSYKTINDIIGALEGAKLEFYRRIAIPYENNKKFYNGDVYDDQINKELARTIMKSTDGHGVSVVGLKTTSQDEE